MSQARSGPSLWSDPPLDGMPWTVLHLVTWSSGYLEGKGITGARLDVEHLLAHTLGMDRLQLYLLTSHRELSELIPEDLFVNQHLLLALLD